MLRNLVIACALLLSVGPVRGQGDAGVRVYADTLKSTVWIRSDRGSVSATGSGSLVDRNRRLILTNYHVVGDVDRATVYFPSYPNGGPKPVAEKEFYEQRARLLGIRGRVVARDRQADLALIQIESVPANAQALKLAESSPAPGATVHSVGNPGKSGALWVYTPGKVRQVYHKRWKAKLDSGIIDFNAQVIETDSPTNPGDSGGPLVNDKAELVGVTQGGSVDAQALSLFIDVSEVKRFLATRDVRNIDPQPPMISVPANAEARTIRDEGKFFSAAAIQRAEEEIRRIAKSYGREVLIETYATVPNEDREKVQGLTGKARDDYFAAWADRRERAEKVNGVIVLICKEPAHLYLDVSDSAKSSISRQQFQEVRSKLLEKFKTKSFDEGLEQMVKQISEAMAKRQR